MLAAVNATASDRPADRGVGTVLVATPERFPSVRELERELTQGGRGSPPLPPVAVHWLRSATANEAIRNVHQARQSGLRISALYTSSQVWARALQIANPDLPIVFSGVDDPTHHCLVDSIGRPGRSATGHMHFLPDSEAKMLEWLLLAYPQTSQVVVAVSEFNREQSRCDGIDDEPSRHPSHCGPRIRLRDAYVSARLSAPRLDAVARDSGVKLRFAVVCDIRELARLALSHPDSAVLVPWHELFAEAPQRVVDVLARHRRPVVYPMLDHVDCGGLMGLEPADDSGPYRPTLLALYAILNGVAPSTLPVHAPRGFVTALNASVAEAMPRRPALAALRRADILVASGLRRTGRP